MIPNFECLCCLEFGKSLYLHGRKWGRWRWRRRRWGRGSSTTCIWRRRRRRWGSSITPTAAIPLVATGWRRVLSFCRLLVFLVLFFCREISPEENASTAQGVVEKIQLLHGTKCNDRYICSYINRHDAVAAAIIATNVTVLLLYDKA